MIALNPSGLSIIKVGAVTRMPEKTIIIHGADPPDISCNSGKMHSGKLKGIGLPF